MKNTKVCCVCKVEKPKDAFPLKSNGRYNGGKCKLCYNAHKLERAGKMRQTEPRTNQKHMLVRRRYTDEFWAAALPGMISDYETGMGCVQLAAKYGISDETIRKQLKKAGVVFRTKEESNNLQSVYQAARRTNGATALLPHESTYLAVFRKKRLRELIGSILNGAKCMDCGEADPVVLDFDHRDPSKKSFNITLAARSKGAKAVLAEIELCDIVCKNCHARRTAKMFGNWRLALEK